MQFVTAFNRDRDLYQVPLALNEGSVLERLVTDLYLPNKWRHAGPARLLGLSHRYAQGLPSKKVSMSLPAIFLQTVGKRLVRRDSGDSKLFALVDKLLSRKSLRIAQESGAALFTYSSYALEAFSDVSMKDRRKILFVYHPPSEGFMDILREDLESYPEMAWSYAAHEGEMAHTDGERLAREIALADEVVCASSFTERTIRRINQAVPIHVVPYGVNPRPKARLEKPSLADARARLLFVGQGLQRKGLHHLLKAWNRCGAQDAELTIVSGRMDPAIREAIKNARGTVHLKSQLSKEKLQQEYDAADIFVMPSLVEGFGLVFLEALAAGCFCIATPNTGIADLNLPGGVAKIVGCGNIDSLEGAIDDAIKMVRDKQLDVASIQHAGALRPWTTFRAAIRDIANQGSIPNGEFTGRK